MLSEEPTVKIMTLLSTNWNPANTQTITPKFHTGWYNTAWNTIPQLTVTEPDYTVMRGGETGITAFSGGGDLKRWVFADMIVAPWAHADMVDGSGASFKSLNINPKTLVWDMSNEVKRIIDANRFSDPELEWWGWLSKARVVETRIKPVVFRFNNMVRCLYEEAA